MVRALVALVALDLGSLSLATAARTAAARPTTASTPQLQDDPACVVALSHVEKGSLDSGLVAALHGLLESALASGEGYRVTTQESQAAWRLTLAVSGKGPWRLTARSEPAAQARGAARITEKVSFASRDEMTRAMDQLATSLVAGWRAASPQAACGGAPVPLESSLSPSSAAVDGYLLALDKLHSGDVDGAAHLLDDALATDPVFPLAAAERIYIDLTLGKPTRDNWTAALTPTGGALASPLGGDIASVLDPLLSGKAEAALKAAEGFRAAAPQLPWTRVLRAMALSRLRRHAEALPDWTAAAQAQPDDPRTSMWLGLARMAMGDLKGSAEAFGRARAGWPDLLRAYTLQAEAQARLRDPAAARSILAEMRAYMDAHGIVPSSDDLNPALMLGSVELLEGNSTGGLKLFEEEAGALEKAGVTGRPAYTLLTTIVEMRRDLVVSTDPLIRARQLEETNKALDRYEAALTPEDRASPFELLRLKGLVGLKENKTVDAWKIIDEMKSHAAAPGYSEYYEAYLSAATLLKEGDIPGCAAQFERAAKSRDRIVDLMDAAETQAHLRRFEESRKTFDRIENKLSRYDPATGSGASELVLAEPHLAALVPLFHYGRARLAFETGDAAESRKHFNRMLKYLQHPDESLVPMVEEAHDRGATPE